MVETARSVCDAGVWGVKLHPLYVIRETGLERMCNEGRYRAMTEDEAIDATLAVLESLRPDVVVHRITSDPHSEELAAPTWMLDRRGVRKRLEKAMQERDVRQGARYGNLRAPIATIPA
jgi:radical SAM superfamily enzyme